MYELNDTIVAVSSPTSEQKVIVRLSGHKTVDILQRIFSPAIPEMAGLLRGDITVEPELKIDAQLYLFFAPHSYTGETLVEIHVYANESVTESLMGGLLGKGLRMAGPGEFTVRAYLNGKIDLAQAEAVGEVVASSNSFQLAAAEKLLAGRLGESTAKIRSALIDCLSQIEAGLDFSGEDIEFITRAKAVERLGEIKSELEQLLGSTCRDESIIDLPAVGIAGAPNAGKSSLLNKLLGRERSIVSERRKTTRDVLTGELALTGCRCVLFDCAGLTAAANTIIDELAQQAAVDALQKASVVIFCVDSSKKDFAEDISIRKLIEPEILVPVATKTDSLREDILAERLVHLNELFGADFLATSAKTGAGLDLLRQTIDKKIIEEAVGSAESPASASGVALTARHKQAVTQAIDDIAGATNELNAGNDEVTTMMLRAAHQAISNIEQEPIDEQILEKIFSSFCIGK
jgi:tRNA modification GTPase